MIDGFELIKLVFVSHWPLEVNDVSDVDKIHEKRLTNKQRRDWTKPELPQYLKAKMNL